MAVQAANSGLIPWQAGIATPIGRFQFVLGREVGLSFYRSRRDDPVLIQTQGVELTNATPRRHPLDAGGAADSRAPPLPYLLAEPELQPGDSALYRIRHAASVLSRLSGGRPEAGLRTIGLGGIRVVFDWRYYRVEGGARVETQGYQLL